MSYKHKLRKYVAGVWQHTINNMVDKPCLQGIQEEWSNQEEAQSIRKALGKLSTKKCTFLKEFH